MPHARKPEIIQYFYPRPPGGGRPTACCVAYFSRNFYPRPPGGGRPEINRDNADFGTISIHALRVEGDREARGVRCRRLADFYPRPPGGGRLFFSKRRISTATFLSTPSGWRATPSPCRKSRPPGYISIHALRVEGDKQKLFFARALFFISIHALRVEGDGQERDDQHACGISIHALRVEGDSTLHSTQHRALNFYPRPPGGGRHDAHL